MHRGITARCIGLSSRDHHHHHHQTKQIKLGKVGYHTLLLDLHRLNAFGGDAASKLGSTDESAHAIPKAW